MTSNSLDPTTLDGTDATPDRVSELLLRNLLDVFDERDGDRRLAAIAELWAPDAVFVDPEGRFVGHAALDATVAQLQGRTAGWRFSAAGTPLVHPGGGELSWSYGPPEDPARVTGTDVAVVRGGRIATLYAIVGAPAPAPAPEPTDAVLNTVQAFFGHVGAGELDQAIALFTEQVDWLISGNQNLAWTGARSRPEEVADVLTTIGGLHVPGESVSEIRQILVDGADAVVLGRIAHTTLATGRRYDMPVAFHLTVRDGRIARLHMYEDTYLVSQAFEPIA
ncbi:MAG TPA: nuclear transport factor 2 family protein [Pseudonocardia sp.]|jgi:hypothetical protein|nr:nuclear transport factor 2 family protein [Pseudonocardia sp.]